MEAALWDLVGRAYGVPIHSLLGGRFRDSVRMYADCHAGEALESLDATMVARPARWGQEPPEAVKAGSIRALEHGRAYARAAPDDLFTPELYAQRAREVVAELGFSALKFDLDVPTPYMQDGFREAFESGAIDIAAPDLQKGGLLEGRRIADYADTHYISLAPHCIASPIGTIAAVHVAAAVPNFLALEWHGMSVPFWEDLAAGWEGKVIESGRIRVPDGSGLGVELNLDVAREYARDGEPFFDE